MCLLLVGVEKERVVEVVGYANRILRVCVCVCVSTQKKERKKEREREEDKKKQKQKELVRKREKERYLDIERKRAHNKNIEHASRPFTSVLPCIS